MPDAGQNRMPQPHGNLRPKRCPRLGRHGFQLGHQRDQRARGATNRRLGQRLCDLGINGPDAVQDRNGKGLHHALGIGSKVETMHHAGRDKDDRSLRQGKSVAIYIRRATPRKDVEHLRQLRVPMRRDVPRVIRRAVLDPFAMENIGKAFGFAKKRIAGDR